MEGIVRPNEIRARMLALRNEADQTMGRLVTLTVAPVFPPLPPCPPPGPPPSAAPIRPLLPLLQTPRATMLALLGPGGIVNRPEPVTGRE
jgi:hypothetical protein